MFEKIHIYTNFGLGGGSGPTGQMEHSPLNTNLVKQIFCCITAKNQHETPYKERIIFIYQPGVSFLLCFFK